MRLGGLRGRTRLSRPPGWGTGRSVIGERDLILSVRAYCTALLAFSFCEANVQSMSIDCFRVFFVTAMTNVDRT